MLDAEGFKVWLLKGPERFPNLYGGNVKHPQVASADQTPSVNSTIPVTVDRKQATSDHDDGDSWDGIEP